MTSQILIMNRLGFTLASDSAVSSGKFSSNSVQKIFSLPGRQPVAFMVMGSGTHAPSGLSWDRVFYKYHKHFISKHGKNAEFKTMGDYETDFNSFLSSILSKANNGFAISRDLVSFFGSTTNYIWEGVSMSESPEYATNPGGAIEKFGANILSTLDFFESKLKGDVERTYQFNKVKQLQLTDLKFSAQYIIETGSSKTNLHIPADKFQDLMVDFLAHHLVHYKGDDGWKDTNSTIVLAGFGSEEEFPSYFKIKSCSVVEGIPVENNVEKSVVSPLASVSPEFENGAYSSLVFMESFAVKDFTSRMTTGLDSSLIDNQQISKEVQNLITGWFEQNGVEEFKKVAGVGGATAEKLVEHILNDVRLPWKMGNKHWHWVSNSATGIKNDFRESVNRLSPIDLAKMATHLIETEAVMSSFVSPTKYVDLPVDCCYVTKENGFVWKALKNIPDSKINPKIFNQDRDGTLFF